MTSDIKSVLEGLNRKELVEIANRKKISIPNNWSRSLIVELLVLNVTIDNIQQIEKKPSKPKITSEGICAIVIKDLVKKFEDVTAVDNLSLEIMEGELFSLLGPNGAGKTTTINILNGIMKPTKGTATIAGFDVTKSLVEIKEIIGLCPQEAAVFKFLNARENIELFGNLHSLSKKEIEERTDMFLELLGLAEASERKAGGFSGGMLRKLNLIIALISNPKIAFLDEPTVGMDARARRKTWEFIGSLKAENKTIVLTTHYIEEAETLSDRVGIIDYGKLVELGTPKELMERHEAKNLEEVFLSITGRRIMEGI
ncbi:MAG: ATP-binding cassette domain-containing protein [Candidatus Bathyarchaeota archaeon]|nr:MAG: ATP-binding cassette domain-containing protein [Candidatus Bathyarchaeota archaeon]